LNNIFLFDVDGTIAVGDIILDSTIKALEDLRAKGNIVMLSTGRCIGQMKDLLQKIKIDGAICNNGAYAYIGNDVIFESPISKDVINQMLDDGLHVTFLARDSYFRLDDLKIYDDFAKVFNIVPAELQDKNYLMNNNIYSIGVQDYILDFDVTKYDLNFIKVCNLGYDVINKGINKSTPIKYIKEKYKNYRIISFGDNLNDLEMLKASDISFAMGQAPDVVKESATYVTKKPLEDGIKYAIDNYLGELL
jgi:Cof subfamily protein (haloacid dehalogenase superfamily)